MKTRIRLVIVTALVAGITSVAPVQAAKKADIVDTAVSAGSFNTLAAALKAAGLVDALKGEGPFTVFAPTDDAFAQLPKGTVETLLKPENKAALTGILTYHVVSGAVPASEVVNLSAAETLNGQRVDIKVKKGKVKVDGARVVTTDITCSNGVIHVIDRVILPSSDNIPTTAANAGNFNTLLAAVKAAGLVDALSGKGPLTVFAPTDEAFAKLPEGTIASLLKEENRDKLVAILKYHVVPGRIFSDAALKAGTAETLQGGSLRISASDAGAMVNDAKLVATDIDAANGVIHVVDSVLIPPTGDKAAAVDAGSIIEQALAEATKLNSNGQRATFYGSVARQVLDLDNHGMSKDAVHTLRVALHQAGHSHCTHAQASILHRGLTTAHKSMAAAR